jgi:hypothetical protein
MSEPNPTGSTPFTVFDYLGLGFLLVPPAVVVEALMKGETLTLTMLIYAVPAVLIGAVSIYIGRHWDKLKIGTKSSIVSAVEYLSGSYVVLFLIFVLFLVGIAISPILLWPPSQNTAQVETRAFSTAPTLIGVALLLFIGAVIGATIFRRGISWQSLSHQELDYRTQQRKFILSNLYEMLTTYLSVMSVIGDNCGRVVGNGSASQMHWFANYALDRGIRRQYVELHEAATNNFVNISTEAINNNILQFLLEYQNVSSFPGKIERLADLGKTSRDNWDASHQRCRSALLDLKASSFSGILSESATMETLQTMPRNQ